MLSLKELKGFVIETKDGTLGKVHDFFFDDASWTVRYLVADTGAWLPGRLVLISPAAFLAPDRDRGVFPVRLTKKQVMGSPVIEADMPVSRQQELKLSRYYEWPAYWMGAPWFMVGVPPLLNQPGIEAVERKRADELAKRSDPHLRSFREIRGYRVEASDGAAGRVVDLVVDEKEWVVRAVAVDARPWFPGGDVLLPPSRIKSMLWRRRRIVADMSRDEIKTSPAYRAGAGGVAMPTKAQWSRYHEERSGPKKRRLPRRPRRDGPVDTSKAGTSASDRKVGHGSTASRNFSRRSAENAPYALEDSATGRPSRKSTRKSANRSKPSHPQRRSKRFERLRERTLARSK